ncbi:MAG: tyrosine--tRNA ligase [Deltaproteobacteria bacterium]|nr:tyrosine--tRNA ligase [Deltaproteobacteria bacterium]
MATLARGAVELISEADLVKKLETGRPLRIKAGFDPTAPDLHLGHTVLMHKLRQFQELGHQIIFLVGDFTARIGDPSGRSKTRPPLSEAEIQANAATYTDQAFKILNRARTEVRFNSEWLGKLTPAELIHLSAQYTLARMIEREDFSQRLADHVPLSLHELWYPLLQGYDSVALRADVELGGQDQKFNLVVAREIQKSYGQAPEVILMMPLLEGTDGVQKMSKSYGNQIGILEPPNEMFGKVMSVADDVMWKYFDLLSARSAAEIEALRAGHPKAAKIALAQEIVARFHSPTAATAAAAEFEQVFAQRGVPTDVEESRLPLPAAGQGLVDLIFQLGLAASKGEARRLIIQGGVRINETVAKDPKHILHDAGTYLLQVGKRKFHRVVIGE